MKTSKILKIIVIISHSRKQFLTRRRRPSSWVKGGVIPSNLDDTIIILLLRKAIVMELIIKPSSSPIFQVKPGQWYHLRQINGLYGPRRQQPLENIFMSNMESNNRVNTASLTINQEQRINSTMKAMMTLKLQSICSIPGILKLPEVSP